MTSFLGVGSKAGKIVYAEDIECVVDPVNGIGGIFIGNLEASQNLATLRSTHADRQRTLNQSSPHCCKWSLPQPSKILSPSV